MYNVGPMSLIVDIKCTSTYNKSKDKKKYYRDRLLYFFSSTSLPKVIEKKILYTVDNKSKELQLCLSNKLINQCYIDKYKKENFNKDNKFVYFNFIYGDVSIENLACSINDILFLYNKACEYKEYKKYVDSKIQETSKNYILYKDNMLKNVDILQNILTKYNISTYKLEKIIKKEITVKERNKERSLLTKELRQKVIERDLWTCQKCGKLMLDEVGLHIDHIIPISKGGLTIEDNLQVLCSKCNGAKGNK